MTTPPEDLLRDIAPLVRSLANSTMRRYFAWSLSFDDLYADGLYGAYLASEKWKPDGGASWTTYAHPWITRYMTLGVRFALWETTRGDGGDMASLDAIRDAATEGGSWDLPDETLPDQDLGPVREHVRGAVRELDSTLRQIVYRTYWMDEGPTEVGRHIGMTKSTVRNRLKEAHTALADPLRPIAA